MLHGPLVQRTSLVLRGCIHSCEKPKLPHRPIQLQWQGILDEEPALTADLRDSKRQKYRSKEKQHSGVCSRDLHCLSLTCMDFTLLGAILGGILENVQPCWKNSELLLKGALIFYDIDIRDSFL